MFAPQAAGKDLEVDLRWMGDSLNTNNSFSVTVSFRYSHSY